ncbi:MAG: alkaline phosphatase family protein, partial [Thermoplasmata archaeon]
IHARRLAPFFATHFRTIFDFYEDAREGELPNYAFIEPNMLYPHTDMHPQVGARWAEDLHLPPPDTLIGGDQLLADVYNAVRGSSVATGSYWANTALLVTFDEHGGTFDHVPPPGTIAPDSSPGEMGFAFDRLGVRIPTVLVSAWTDERRVVTDQFQGTSLLRTLRDWWRLGEPLTRRDAGAPSLLPVLSRAFPREPESWPKVTPRVPGILGRAEQVFLRGVESLAAPMERMEHDLLGDALAWEADSTKQPLAADLLKVTHSQAHEHLRRIGANAFPGVGSGRKR